MRSAISFEKTIDAESISWLIEQINSLDPGINIYINSEGGLQYSVLAVIDFINEVYIEKQITLIGFGQISSAAFDMFWKCKCPKRIIPGTYAVIHKTSMEIDESNPVHNEQKKVMNEQDAIFYKFLKDSKAISPNDLRNFNNHKDLVVGHDRLCKLLKLN